MQGLKLVKTVKEEIALINKIPNPLYCDQDFSNIYSDSSKRKTPKHGNTSKYMTDILEGPSIEESSIQGEKNLLDQQMQAYFGNKEIYDEYYESFLHLIDDMDSDQLIMWYHQTNIKLNSYQKSF